MFAIATKLLVKLSLGSARSSNKTGVLPLRLGSALSIRDGDEPSDIIKPCLLQRSVTEKSSKCIIKWKGCRTAPTARSSPSACIRVKDDRTGVMEICIGDNTKS
ncbi:unnamed protein product [Acanthoscelides obtectus]|uniref:Uncharacterized protein n=1 Tax=Acanthoscelides obtectus TaxID=200917 RepID=A0A9P0L7R0_ACAOB|nr:unnamed protein product [Acanthoscelides obtectus]CAK1648851.1 hypothetical protein AOBTE_LOCUS15926 [Acanthoscelides obtectus]